MRGLSILTVLLCVFAFPAVASDELCARLKAFIQAPLEREVQGKEIPRSVEYHWTGEWLVKWGTECRPSSGTAAKDFCAWLPEHVSQERPDFFPLCVLECNGVKFPHPYPRIGPWLSAIAFDDAANNQTFVMQVDLQGRNPNNQAVRLTLFGKDFDGDTGSLSPIIDERRFPLLKR